MVTCSSRFLSATMPRMPTYRWMPTGCPHADSAYRLQYIHLRVGVLGGVWEGSRDSHPILRLINTKKTCLRSELDGFGWAFAPTNGTPWLRIGHDIAVSWMSLFNCSFLYLLGSGYVLAGPPKQSPGPCDMWLERQGHKLTQPTGLHQATLFQPSGKRSHQCDTKSIHRPMFEQNPNQSLAIHLGLNAEGTGSGTNCV